MKTEQEINEVQALLDKYNACNEAKEWSKSYTSIDQAWRECKRGDWMLWLVAKANLCTRQELVLAACQCARLALKHVLEGEDRPRLAIETAEAWARGKATAKAVQVAADASAAYADYDPSAASSAYSAAYAAYTSTSASTAAYSSASAYAASASAAYAAYDPYDSATAARKEAMSTCADLVRHLYKGESNARHSTMQPDTIQPVSILYP